MGHILSAKTTIDDCAFIGSITGDKGSVYKISGLVAWGDDDGKTTIRNSYVNAGYSGVWELNPILRRKNGSRTN